MRQCAGLHRCRQDRHRAEGRQRPVFAIRIQRVVRGLRALARAAFAIVVVIDSPHGKNSVLTAGRWPRRSFSVSPTRRIASPWNPAIDQPAAAGVRCAPRRTRATDARDGSDQLSRVGPGRGAGSSAVLPGLPRPRRTRRRASAGATRADGARAGRRHRRRTGASRRQPDRARDSRDAHARTTRRYRHRAVPSAETHAMTVGELLQGVALRHAAGRATGAAARRPRAGRAVSRRDARLAARRGGVGVRCAARSESDGVDFAPQAIAAGAAAVVADRPHRRADRRALDRREGRAARAGVARGGVLRASEPRDAGGRHHGDERQDDDRLRAELDFRGCGHALRTDGNGDVPDRDSKSSRRPGRRPRRRSCRR